MYTLYWAPGTGSLAVQAVLEEVGAPYRLHRLDLAAGEHQAARYLKINPNGVVPALVDGDGRAYFEAAGLVMLLCDRHPERALAPPPVDPLRGRYYQWLLFMADTIYPAYSRWFHGDRFSTDPADGSRVREKAHVDLLAKWRIIDDALADTPYLLGVRPSACDLFMLMLVSWFQPLTELSQSCPKVVRCAQEIALRPAVARALDTHEQRGDLTRVGPAL